MRPRKQPNVRATVQEVFDGMKVISQNRWPSLAFDVGASTICWRRSLPPASTTRPSCGRSRPGSIVYEPQIRAAAGLGVAPKEADTDHYANRFAHCDVLVVGAGVAGLSAALAAAETGARVIICDEQPEVGGALHFDTSVTIDGMDGFDLGAGDGCQV